jgi:cytochrome c2
LNDPFVVRRRTWVSLLVVALCAGLGAGCGGSGPVKKGDIAHGRLLFMNGTGGKRGCVFCHPIAAAGANGPFAPNLDNIYQFDWKSQGFSETKIRRVVLDQILRDAYCQVPNLPGQCMPKKIVTGQDAVDVASFVAQCAGHKGSPGCRPDHGGARPGSEAARGWQLYTRLWCAGCHSTDGNAPGSNSPKGLAAAVGPSFKGLFGSKVKLTNGQTVTADEAYLLASIVDPDAQIVRGFRPGVMTAMIKPGGLPPAQVRALIAYIKTLS